MTIFSFLGASDKSPEAIPEDAGFANFKNTGWGLCPKKRGSFFPGIQIT